MFSLFNVRPSVEVGEEIDEETSVRKEKSSKEFVCFATEANGDCHVKDNSEELDELNPCHVLFPPQIFTVLGSQGSNEVVEVHENVDGGVD